MARFADTVTYCIINNYNLSMNSHFNPLCALIEILNLTACAMLVINCVQAGANEPSAFLGAHHCFTAYEGGPLLVSRFFPTTLGKIESGAVL